MHWPSYNHRFQSPDDLDQMRYQDDSDFMNSYNVYSASPPSSDHAFERDFCSNFTCCGQSLADLHLLLDHLEEAHVFLMGSNGRPIYPLPSSHPILDSHHHSYSSPSSPLSISNPCRSNGSSSPCSSHVSEYPHTSSPMLYDFEGHDPMRHSYQNPNPSNDGNLMLSTTIADFEFDFEFRKSQVLESFPDEDDTANYYSPPAISDADGQQESKEDMVPSPSSEAPPIIHDPSFTESDGRPTDRELRNPPFTSEEILPNPSPTRKKMVGNSKPTPTRSRRGGARERIFKCPRSGCTKSYLNPNGLKYHLDKGTCEIAHRGGKQ